MNIFIDSNILYGNPYFDEGGNKELLRKMKQTGGQIFISEIVVMETRNNHRKNLEKINESIEKLKSTLKRNKVKTKQNFERIDIEAELKRFDKKYQTYEENKDIVVLKPDNDFLQVVIERSINRIKPFTEKKQEFRDCLIWLTYAKKVESEKLENCFFIAKNHSDFCALKPQKEDAEKKDAQKKLYDSSKIHEDLLKDTKRLKIYDSVSTFFKGEKLLLEKLSKKDTLKDLSKSTYEELEIIINKIFEEEFYLEDISGLNEKKICGLADFEVSGYDIMQVTVDKIIISNLDINLDELNAIVYARTMVTVYLDVFDEERERIGNMWIEAQCDVYFEISIIEDNLNEMGNGENYYKFNDETLKSIRIENFNIMESDAMDLAAEYQASMDLYHAEQMEAMEEYYSH